MAWGVVQDDRTPFPRGTICLTRKTDDQAVDSVGDLKKKGNIICEPQPSDDPNDPLNWSQGFKIAHIMVLIFLSGVANALISMLTPGLIILAQQFNVSPDLTSTLIIGAIGFWTAFASFPVVSGAGIWGRRPFYLSGILILAIVNGIAYVSKTFEVLVAMRIIAGLAMAPLFTLVTASISDIFFTHEKGMFIAMWNLSLNVGAQLSQVIAGFVTDSFGVEANFGITALLFALFLPVFYLVGLESLYTRSKQEQTSFPISDSKTGLWEEDDLESPADLKPLGPNHGITTFFPRRLSNKSFWKCCVKPFALIIFPPVFFSTCIFSVFFAFLVGVPILTAVVFSAPPYALSPSLVGLTNLPLVGVSLVGAPLTGWIGDAVARVMARRNRSQPGVFEPEFRLILLIFSGPITTVGLIGLGASLDKNLPLIWPLLWMSVLTFGALWTTQNVLTYVVDCLPSQASEAFAIINLVAAVIIFVSSGSLITFDAMQGHSVVFGMLAAVSVIVVAMEIPLYIFGKRIRGIITRTGWTLSFY